MAKRGTATAPDYSARLARAVRHLDDPLLVALPENVRYLSGFSGSYGYILLSPGQSLFITDGRYQEQVASSLPPDLRLVVQEQALAHTLQQSKLLPSHSLLYLESEAFTLAQAKQLHEKLGDLRLEAHPSPVTPLRAVKDGYEIAVMERALRLTEEAMVYIAASMEPGIREREVAARLEYYCRRKGAEKASFDFIVASGARSALPHGVAGERQIGPNELVLFDFGIRMHGYCSDFTRVVYTGKKPPRRLARLWALVHEAYHIGLQTVAGGVPAATPDENVRAFFRRKRVLPRYTHSLGHGVGLAIHEAPRLSWQSDQVLQTGMVVTVEPGLYVPGYGGIRLENMVLVGKRGARELTDFSQEMACLGW